MGVASTVWMKAIDGAAVTLADHPANSPAVQPDHVLKLEAETYKPVETTTQQATQATPGGAR